jgi:hypothetical protein
MDDLIQQLQQQIHQDAHHAAEEAVNSPTMINRVIGESMRHIGGVLENQSAMYLPIRPEEILVKPIRIFDNNDALLLVNREMPTSNSFTVLAVSTTKDGQRTFGLNAFKMDRYTLHKSKFLSLAPIIGNEIIRQLNSLSQADGLSLHQCVIVKDYFKEETEENTSGEAIFNSDTTSEPTASQLPPVSPIKPQSVNQLPPVDGQLL